MSKETTANTISIKPAKADVQVPKPDGSKLKAEGEIVKRSAYWVRRLNDGDVVLVESKQSAASTVTSTATEKGA